jgi:hypothetical protein
MFIASSNTLLMMETYKEIYFQQSTRYIIEPVPVAARSKA